MWGPTKVEDSVSKFIGAVCPDGLDLAARTSEMLQRYLRVVTTPCRHGVTFLPAGCATIEDNRVFVAMKALTLFTVCDKMVSCQLFAELLWQRANGFLAAVRSVVKLGLLTGVEIEALGFVVM